MSTDVAITSAQAVDICSEGDMRDRRATGKLQKINSVICAPKGETKMARKRNPAVEHRMTELITMADRPKESRKEQVSGCPVNKRFFRWFEEEESFTENETEAILRGTSLNQFPEATVEKLRRTFLSDQLDVLPRNLNVLLEQRLSRCLIISSLSLR